MTTVPPSVDSLKALVLARERNYRDAFAKLIHLLEDDGQRHWADIARGLADAYGFVDPGQVFARAPAVGRGPVEPSEDGKVIALVMLVEAWLKRRPGAHYSPKAIKYGVFGSYTESTWDKAFNRLRTLPTIVCEGMTTKRCYRWRAPE